MKKFVLIGAAGFVAPRHLQAIRETGNELIAIHDKNDSVGIIDSYFPKAIYFDEFERFDRYVSKYVLTQKNKLDYVSICTPNYLHDANIRFALRSGADAICEKPLVLNPWNIDALKEQEQLYGKKIYNVLQLRLHPSIIALKEKVEKEYNGNKYDIDLTYITSRGSWYYNSWKGDEAKSGGLASNIGVHFFDMLGWIFGKLQTNKVHLKNKDANSGFLEFEKARVRWFLSINSEHLPDDIKQKGQTTYRSLTMNSKEIEFSNGFKDLHTAVYQDILNGGGYGLDDAYPSIEMIHDIRNAEVYPVNGVSHPYVSSKLFF